MLTRKFIFVALLFTLYSTSIYTNPHTIQNYVSVYAICNYKLLLQCRRNEIWHLPTTQAVHGTSTDKTAQQFIKKLTKQDFTNIRLAGNAEEIAGTTHTMTIQYTGTINTHEQLPDDFQYFYKDELPEKLHHSISREYVAEQLR